MIYSLIDLKLGIARIVAGIIKLKIHFEFRSPRESSMKKLYKSE
jgi:hypothetical protein